MGARHFVKEELPRTRWANPLLEIAVHKVPKMHEHLKRRSGLVTMDVDDRHVQQVVDGHPQGTHEPHGDTWKAYKSAALAAGHFILPGEEKERLAQITKRHKANTSAFPQEPEEQVQEMQFTLSTQDGGCSNPP